MDAIPGMVTAVGTTPLVGPPTPGRTVVIPEPEPGTMPVVETGTGAPREATTDAAAGTIADATDTAEIPVVGTWTEMSGTGVGTG